MASPKISLRIRGFRSLTQRYDLFYREVERDGYNIQRADIVKGANSLMYGQADPGGLINSVPKMAQHNKDFARIKGTVGNKNYERAEFDSNHVINDELAVRLMGMDMSRDLRPALRILKQNRWYGRAELPPIQQNPPARPPRAHESGSKSCASLFCIHLSSGK
jgi:outer membrane receptor protein involved in Fe transport